MYTYALSPEKMRDLIRKEKCPRCCKEHVMKESPQKGEYYCSNWGYVSDFPYIDNTLEHRQFEIQHGVKNDNRAMNVGDDGSLFTCLKLDGSLESKKMMK